MLDRYINILKKQVQPCSIVKVRRTLILKERKLLKYLYLILSELIKLYNYLVKQNIKKSLELIFVLAKNFRR